MQQLAPTVQCREQQESRRRKKKRTVTYSIAGSKLLVRRNSSSLALGSIQGRLASQDSLSLRGSAPRLAADLGDGIPVIHCGGCVW